MFFFSSVPTSPVLALLPVTVASLMTLAAMHRIVSDVGAVPVAAEVPERALVQASAAVVPVLKHVPAMLFAAKHMLHLLRPVIQPHVVARPIIRHAFDLLAIDIGQEPAPQSRAGGRWRGEEEEGEEDKEERENGGEVEEKGSHSLTLAFSLSILSLYVKQRMSR